MNNYSIHIMNYLKTQSWQIAALVIIVAAITFVLKNKSAHVRYLLWLIVLAKCLVPPFLTVPLPVLPQPKAVSVLPSAEPIVAAPVLSPVKEVPTTPKPVIAKHTYKLTLHEWLAIGWIIGVAIFITVAVTKAIRTELWLRRERKLLPTGLQSEVKELFTDLGIRILPKLWLAEGVGQPFVWGLLRGGIYLPVNFVKANNTEYRKGVLTHELSHVLRFDAAVNLLQIASQAVFWFHPFVWWANRKIRFEREKCCDEMAIARLGAQVKDYSSAIVNILITEHESIRPVPSLAVAGPVKNIEERIKIMLKPGKKFYKSPSLPVVAVVVLTALLAVPTTLVLTVRAQDHGSKGGAEVSQIFSDPINLGPTVNSSADEFDPSISADGLELYFNSYRTGGFGEADIWVTTRKTKAEPWGTPVNLGPVVNSSSNETPPDISADGLSLYFGSDRPGGYGARDLWVTTRETTSAPWGTPVNLGPTVNSSGNEHGPSISADGLSLYFSGYFATGPFRAGGLGGGDLWVTTRKTKDDTWTEPVNLGPRVNYSGWDASPSISVDDLTLYFNSSRDGGFGGPDLWVTTRKTKDEPWGTPVNLGPIVNSVKSDLNPDVSADGSTLYFASRRSGAVGGSEDSDIWQVSLKSGGVKE